MTVELSLLVKATVALAIGLMAVHLSGRARASVRHLLMASTLGVLLAIPLVAAWAPAVTLAVPVPGEPATDAETRAAAVPAEPRRDAVSLDVGAAGAERAIASRSFPLSAASALRLTWAVGLGLLLTALGHALWKVGRIRRGGIPWLSAQALLDRLAAQAGVSRPISVAVHEDVPAPVTCGWRRPAIVLPADAREWPDADVERALVHELEHVRRGDWLVQLAARLVCAVYWFHPLVWVAWRRLCLECERACDDAVVDRMADTEYAAQLVTLASRLSHADAQPVLSMARRSDLSVRVRAVLDRSQLRGRAGASAVAATTLAAAMLALIIAPMRVQAVPADAPAAAAAAAAQNRPGVVAPSGRRSVSGALGRALVEAANEGDTDGVVELLDAGADVNAVVRGDGTALLIAARDGDRALVGLLLSRGADVNIGVGGDGSPLIMAAREGHLQIVRTLLERGADINLGVEGDGNALIMAARAGRLAVVQLLLDRGASVNEVVDGDENAIISASGAGELSVVRLLVSRGGDVNSRVWASGGWPDARGEWRTPLNQARRGGHTEVVRYLQSVGAND